MHASWLLFTLSCVEWLLTWQLLVAPLAVELPITGAWLLHSQNAPNTTPFHRQKQEIRWRNSSVFTQRREWVWGKFWGTEVWVLQRERERESTGIGNSNWGILGVVIRYINHGELVYRASTRERERYVREIFCVIPLTTGPQRDRGLCI